MVMIYCIECNLNVMYTELIGWYASHLMPWLFEKQLWVIKNPKFRDAYAHERSHTKSIKN